MIFSVIFTIIITGRPFHDYIDRTELREGKGDGEGHTINIDALYRPPVSNSHPAQSQVYLNSLLFIVNVHFVLFQFQDPVTENNNYLLGLLYD